MPSNIKGPAIYLAQFAGDEAPFNSLGAIARWNEYPAEIQNAHRGTLYCLAMATPCSGPAHLKELERAIRELRLKGVLINSSHKGHYPDDDEARGFWELVQDLDIPVMIHPPHVGFGELEPLGRGV